MNCVKCGSGRGIKSNIYLDITKVSPLSHFKLVFVPFEAFELDDRKREYPLKRHLLINVMVVAKTHVVLLLFPGGFSAIPANAEHSLERITSFTNSSAKISDRKKEAYRVCEHVLTQEMERI